MKINNFLKPVSVIKSENSDQLKENIIRIDPLDDNPSESKITMPNCPTLTPERKTNIFLILMVILTIANMAVFTYLFITVYQYWKYSNPTSGKISYTPNLLGDTFTELQGSSL